MTTIARGPSAWRASSCTVGAVVGSDILATKLVKVVDHEITGFAARTARQQARLSLREVARRMGVSAAYVCDLEKGRRPWDMARACRYAAAVGANNAVRGAAKPRTLDGLVGGKVDR